MFDSRIFYLQLADSHRRRPQVVPVGKRQGPRPPERRGVRSDAGR